MRSIMDRLKLTVNESKTHVCRVPEASFDFLGYTFGRCYSPRTGRAYLGSQPSAKKVRKLCETRLDHPSLARPLAFGAEGNIPYLVYSDLSGTAMDAVMRQDGVRPVAEVLQRTRQLADAIDFAASAGVHHGMIAPSGYEVPSGVSASV